MKKGILFILVSMWLLSFNKATAQPPSNLKIGLSYKLKKIPQSYFFLQNSSMSYGKNTTEKSSTGITDSVDYVVHIIDSIGDVLSKAESEKAKIDSTIKVLKSLVADTVGVRGKLFDTLKINAELLKYNKSAEKYKDVISTLKGAKSKLYSGLIDRMKTARNSSTNIPYTKVTALTKPISQQIQALRKESYLNRTYIANYKLTKDTGIAKQAVIGIQDSIKGLICQRTTIREFRKLTRPFTLFPAISKRTSKYFFGNTIDSGSSGNTIVDSSNFYNFQSLTLLYTNNIASNTTVRAQLFSVYAGPLKFDATTYFSLPKSDSSLKKKDSINALAVLANGGGNVTLNAQFPLVAFNYGNDNFLDISFASFLSPKFSFDIDSDASKNSGKFSSYGSAEIVNRLNIVLEKKVQIMGQMTFSNIWGNGLFMDRLGLTADIDRRKMELWSFSFGIGLAKSFTISFTTYKSSVEQISKNLNNTLSFVTNF